MTTKRYAAITAKLSRVLLFFSVFGVFRGQKTAKQMTTEYTEDTEKKTGNPEVFRRWTNIQTHQAHEKIRNDSLKHASPLIRGVSNP